MSKVSHNIVVIQSANHQSATLPIVLYTIALVMQMGGVVLIVWEIIDDRREARRIAQSALPVRWSTVDAVGQAFVDYLSGRRWRRITGVVLIVIGAFVAFAANITALP
jgi:hypothetical protein